MFISSSCCRRISSSCLTTRHVFFSCHQPLRFGSSSFHCRVALLSHRFSQFSIVTTLPTLHHHRKNYKRSHSSTETHTILKWCSSSTVPFYLATVSFLGSILDSISLCATTRLSFRLVSISVQIYRKYLLRFLSLSQRGSFGEEILHKQIRSIITKRQSTPSQSASLFGGCQRFGWTISKSCSSAVSEYTSSNRQKITPPHFTIVLQLVHNCSRTSRIRICICITSSIALHPDHHFPTNPLLLLLHCRSNCITTSWARERLRSNLISL